MRKMISFKLENLPPKEWALIDEWANNQTNIQQSLANIVMHVVQFVGNEDVMDFDVQRKLHTLLSDVPRERVIQKFHNEETVSQPVKQPVQKIRHIDESDDLPNGNDLFEDD